MKRIRYTDKFDDPKSAGRNSGDHNVEERVRAGREFEHRAGKEFPRSHSSRSVLSRFWQESLILLAKTGRGREIPD